MSDSGWIRRAGFVFDGGGHMPRVIVREIDVAPEIDGVRVAVYKFFMDRPVFYIVFPVYAVIAAASVIGYVIYNRGFSRKGITREMLPDTMSEDEKTAFIEDAKRRSEKSRWLLIVAFAFIFTFAFDAFDLFVVQGLFGK